MTEISDDDEGVIDIDPVELDEDETGIPTGDSAPVEGEEPDDEYVVVED